MKVCMCVCGWEAMGDNNGKLAREITWVWAWVVERQRQKKKKKKKKKTKKKATRERATTEEGSEKTWDPGSRGLKEIGPLHSMPHWMGLMEEWFTDVRQSLKDDHVACAVWTRARLCLSSHEGSALRERERERGVRQSWNVKKQRS